ncbi:MAG: o-succinylbenzoate synthase [Angustibacter sp.]
MLPDVEELLADSRVVEVPLRVRFRGVTTREAVLLRGPVGWAEFAPFEEYDDVEAARWLAAAVEAGWSERLAPKRDRIPVNATVPAVSAPEVAHVLARFDGCTTAKVKVAELGQTLADDLARVAEVRSLLGPSGRIRLDANGAWSVDDAIRALAALARYDLEYAEQPCATLEELAQLRRRLARSGPDVLVAADESIRRAQDPARVVARGSADVVVLKVAPLGGVRRALAVAEGCGVPVVVSSALDTSVGLAAGVRLAAVLPDLPFACGLGTSRLLRRDVTTTALEPRGGVLALADAAAVTPDPAALAEVAAPPDRSAWWLDRLRRCHAVLRRRSDGRSIF